MIIRYFFISLAIETQRINQYWFIMIGFIIYIIGLVLCIKAVLEILALNGNMPKKLIAAILIVITSWIGLAVYYFYARENMAQWVK